MMTRRGFLVRLALTVAALAVADRCKPRYPPSRQLPQAFSAIGLLADRGRLPGCYSRITITREMIEQQMRLNALNSQIVAAGSFAVGLR